MRESWVSNHLPSDVIRLRYLIAEYVVQCLNIYTKLRSKMLSTILLLSTCLMSTLSSPIDYPIKIDLPVYDRPESGYNPSGVHLAEPLLPENHPGDDTLGKNYVEPSLTSNKLEPSQVFRYDEPSPVVHGKAEGALLESEGFNSKILSTKENIQHAVAGLLQPKPIVDTIREEEKYGNSGDKFYHSGRAIVGGAESFSNFVNSLIAVPSSFIQSITRAASEKLNALGGKLVGL